MVAAYSCGLRERTVRCYHQGETMRTVADTFNVSVGFVHHIVDFYRNYGQVAGVNSSIVEVRNNRDKVTYQRGHASGTASETAEKRCPLACVDVFKYRPTNYPNNTVGARPLRRHIIQHRPTSKAENKRNRIESDAFLKVLEYGKRYITVTSPSSYRPQPKSLRVQRCQRSRSGPDANCCGSLRENA
ncbi:hypothetical protein BJ322DRAFT_563958 [Thelephora terrestris]|uniref:Uncharacterized protein n=1 Tax=Thelephora terrestris TaxID=56493 RepID=A0A9P6L9X4_9AGAM|nr:hypothetical protein BJ322DRAFT_563958 [Thelephora terrestris]